MSLSRVRIVLVRPKSPGNVGSVARAMKNMGFTELALVAPRRFRRFSADAMAVHATDVLDSAKRFGSLEDAVADCAWVVATTCRPGAYRRRALTPREAAEQVLAVAERQPVAIVFGPEDHGLSNDDLKVCHELVTIPAHSEYPSLNLAQAALLCMYEVFLRRHPATPETAPLATSAAIEHVHSRLQDALLRIGFLPETNPEHVMFSIRRLFGRARLEERDVAIWLGIARQIEWFAEGGRAIAAAKRARGARLK